MSIYVRTCQECGHKQEMKNPALQKTDNWRDAKCKVCNSQSLDYGSDGYERNADNSIVRISDYE